MLNEILGSWLLLNRQDKKDTWPWIICEHRPFMDCLCLSYCTWFLEIAIQRPFMHSEKTEKTLKSAKTVMNEPLFYRFAPTKPINKTNNRRRSFCCVLSYTHSCHSSIAARSLPWNDSFLSTIKFIINPSGHSPFQFALYRLFSGGVAIYCIDS